jgi:glycosyltransferase involved in cell wall biosynthesis
MVCPPEDEELFARVRERAATLPNLELSERVPYDEIQGVYDAAKVFVNTSEWEGWPNSFIQAGLGRAALLSLAVNPDRLFVDYALGAVAGGDWAALLAAARGLLAEESAWRKAGLEAERFVRELHDNERETTAFLQGLPK